jgi:tetratricopeptide (TPR) repeat protein
MKALSVSGTIWFRLGDLALARKRFEAGLVLARAADDDLWVARLLCDIGTVAAAEADFDEASLLLEESAALFRELDVPARLATVLGNIGHIEAERGDYARAIEVTEEALSLQWTHKPNTAIALYNLGSHNLQAGRLEAARDWLGQTVALTLELGFKEVMAYALAAFARLCLLEDDPARAAYLAGIADRLLVDAGILLQPHEQTRFDEAKAKAAEELGDAYAATHDAAMAAPLEDALRQGAVLAEASSSA